MAQEIDAPRVTVVMYHFVRPIAAGAYPRLKGLEVDQFRAQLDYVDRHLVPVTPRMIIDAAAGGPPLPPRAALLTFDDGYTDHVRHVLPLLRDRGIGGVFFPVAQSLVDRRVLDVNKIQFVLACAEPVDIAAAVDARVEASRQRFDLLPLGEYRAAWWKPSRFDPQDVAYVKRMLQNALPAALRHEIVSELFARHVTRDEAGFADDLYFSVDDARQAVDAGMTVGPHGDRHLRLSSLSRAEQELEIDGALRILDALALQRRGFLYCYANGDRNADSEAILAARGCAAAFTTQPEVAVLRPERMLSLPRLDTNDLPGRSQAAERQA